MTTWQERLDAVITPVELDTEIIDDLDEVRELLRDDSDAEEPSC